MSASRSPLSSQQRAVLELVEKSRRPITGPYIAEKLDARNPVTGELSTEGIHQTAASLVRRELIIKTRSRGIVHYERKSR